MVEGEKAGEEYNHTAGQVNWKKELAKAVKTQEGFKTIMSVLAAEEIRNKSQVNAMAKAIESSTNPVADTSSTIAVNFSASKATAATQIKLASIVKKGSSCALD